VQQIVVGQENKVLTLGNLNDLFGNSKSRVCKNVNVTRTCAKTINELYKVSDKDKFSSQVAENNYPGHARKIYSPSPAGK
jgi:hypothetical protein